MCFQNCRKEHLKHCGLWTGQANRLTGKNHFHYWFPLQLGEVNLVTNQNQQVDINKVLPGKM